MCHSFMFHHKKNEFLHDARMSKKVLKKIKLEKTEVEAEFLKKYKTKKKKKLGMMK